MVGTILTAINHGGALLAGHWPVMQIILTYCVPYLVATYGAITASRLLPPHAKRQNPPNGK